MRAGHRVSVTDRKGSPPGVTSPRFFVRPLACTQHRILAWEVEGINGEGKKEGWLVAGWQCA